MSYQSSRIIENIVDNENLEDYGEQLSEQEADVVEMVIELDSQNSVTIEIHENDDPVKLAKRFCYQHNIDPKIINSFAKNIKNIQASSFTHQEDYGSLIHQDDSQKENNASISNAMTRNDTGMGRSKATFKKHHTTYNNEDTVSDRSGNWSQANNSRGSVFDRLYHDSKAKNARRLSRSKIETGKESKKVLNDSLYHNTSTESGFQVKIYEKNLKLRQETIKKSEMMKEQYTRLEESKCTTKPQINPLSKLIAEKLREVNPETLSKSREKNVMRTIDYLREREMKELKQCTFHPKILNKSRKQLLNTERYLLLHEDHSLRELKAQTSKAAQVKKIFETSSPSINQISRKIVSGKTFDARMEEYRSSAERKKRIIEREASTDCIHHPSTGKQPDTRNKGTMSVGEYLYAKSLQKKKQSVEKKKKLEINKKSEKIYEENKKHAFRYLFTLMDNDADGLISSLKINILGVDSEILHLLAPLLCEMEDLQIELDEEEFVDSLGRLFNTFNIHQKNLILNVYKNPMRKSQKSEQPSFHPSLNEKSVELARQIREPGVSLYEIGREKQIQRESRLSELRALRVLMEYEECTFHPNLFHHHQ